MTIGRPMFTAHAYESPYGHDSVAHCVLVIEERFPRRYQDRVQTIIRVIKAYLPVRGHHTIIHIALSPQW